MKAHKPGCVFTGTAFPTVINMGDDRLETDECPRCGVQFQATVVWTSCDKALSETLEFAKKHGRLQDFLDQVQHVRNIASNHTGARVKFCKDFSPHSFVWVIRKADGNMVMNGGLIFHGPHDGFGSGQGPTYSVTLNPTDGWSIHT